MQGKGSVLAAKAVDKCRARAVSYSRRDEVHPAGRGGEFNWRRGLEAVKRQWKVKERQWKVKEMQWNGSGRGKTRSITAGSSSATPSPVLAEVQSTCRRAKGCS